MEETDSVKKLFLIFIIFSYVAVIIFFNNNTPVTDSIVDSIADFTPVVIAKEKNIIASPLYLKIPSIKINTILEEVGLTAKGAVAVPENISKAAWFNLSAQPGDNGSTVIVGHFGFKSGLPAIFNNLASLKPGDKIYLQDKNGIVNTFVVKKLQRYNQDAKVPEIFSVSDSKSHLNLITCDGVWNKVLKNYPERLVIFSDKE